MHASRSTILLAILVMATIILSACAQAPTPAPAPTNAPAPTSATAPTTAPAATTAPAQAPAASIGLKVTDNAKLGKFIADSAGRSLYIFTKDAKDTSNCYDQCATTWPPVIASAKPALDGIDASLLGTTTRKDGSTQVTLNGMPLYYYAKDQNAGDVNGEGVGGVWFVVSPSGDIIKGAAAQSSSSSSSAAANAAPSGKNVGLKVAETAALGKFIADSDNRTLYMFEKDTKNTSNCYDQCAAVWPPLTAFDKSQLPAGLDASLLGTATRKDGTAQVTFNGMPLYYYAPDANPGDVKGQGVGSVWWVVSPSGDVIKNTAAQGSSSASSSAANAAPSTKSVGLMIAENATLGKFIADSASRSLYMFDKDTKNVSNCYDQCATNWPPLTGFDKSQMPAGLDANLLGTTTRKDGTAQVTYNGFPLYYYAKDQNPGDVKGQAVGGVWWVLSPTGDPIHAGGAASAPAPAPTQAPAPSGNGYGGYGQ